MVEEALTRRTFKVVWVPKERLSNAYYEVYIVARIVTAMVVNTILFSWVIDDWANKKRITRIVVVLAVGHFSGVRVDKDSV